MKRIFGIILTLSLVLGCLFVPFTVTAEEKENVSTENSGFYFTDFSSEDFKVFAEGEVATDADGNEFVPFVYHSYYADERTTSKTELVTLTDGNGEEKTLLDIKSTSKENGKFVNSINLILTDENGKPFVIENNATYKVEYKLYAKNLSSWRNLNFGRGGIRSFVKNGNLDEIDGNTTAEMKIPYTSKNYDYNNSPSNFEERTNAGGWYLPNGTTRVNLTYNTAFAVENWYDKPMSGTLMFSTDEYDIENNTFSIIADDGVTQLTFNNYFAMHIAIGYGVDVPAEILLDYVKVSKVIENVTFDANGGTVNNAATAQVSGYAGELLPTPVRSGNWIFDGWTLADGTAVSDVYAPALDGKTLVANWVEGVRPVVYDFEHSEIMYTGPEKDTILGIDGVEYSIGSWCFQTSRANSAGLGRNGSVGLRCGAGDQTWGVNGCYPLNDGTNFYYLEPGASYTVTLDILVTELVDRPVNSSFHLVYGPYYNGSGWSTDSTRYRDVLTNVIQYVDGVATFPNATSVVAHDDGWKTLTFKFTAPDKFPNNDASFPLSNIMAFYGQWTKGITLVYDNIVVEKAPSVNFVLENGDSELQKYFVGDKVEFPKSDDISKDVYFEDGTGYTTFGFNWYADAECTILADTENTYVTNKNLTFYQKNNTLIDYNDNQVSYFGFENGKTLTGFENVSGGYESATAGKVNDAKVVMGNGSLKVGATYKLSFYYKANNNFNFIVNDETYELKSAEAWTKADISFVAESESLEAAFAELSDEIIVDTIIVSKVVDAEGFSILTDEAESQVNKQAIRTYFSYNSDNFDVINLNGEEYDVAERGVVLISAANFNGSLNCDSENAIVIKKNGDFDECWSYDNGKVIFSSYVKDLGLNDKRGVYAVGYVELSDGVIYYSEIQSSSVEYMKKAELYKTATNTYSLKDKEVRDNVILQQRYDLTDNGVTFDWTAATLKYTSISRGKATVKFVINNVVDSTTTTGLTCNFAVVIDGVLQDASYSVKGNAGDAVSFTFDVGDEFKERVIEVARVNERGICLLDLVDFTIQGELLKTDEQDILIEFIGDSVTCAGAMGGDGISSYAYRTVHALGVDFRMVSQSGTGLMYNSSGGVNDKSVWTRGYKLENYMRSKTTTTTYDRAADIVVINVGTNDIAARFAGNCSWNTDDFVAAGKSLIADVKAQNPNAIIVWCTKGMEGGHTKDVNATIEALGGPANGYYVLDFGAAYHDGSDNWHPGVEGHKSMSETMINWFLESGLLD